MSESRSNKRERGIWQRRFWEPLSRNEADLAHHVNYVHYNPVKHDHVRRVVDWLFSSFNRFVRLQRLCADWGGGEAPKQYDFFGMSLLGLLLVRVKMMFATRVGHQKRRSCCLRPILGQG